MCTDPCYLQLAQVQPPPPRTKRASLRFGPASIHLLSSLDSHFISNIVSYLLCHSACLTVMCEWTLFVASALVLHLQTSLLMNKWNGFDLIWVTLEAALDPSHQEGSSSGVWMCVCTEPESPILLSDVHHKYTDVLKGFLCPNVIFFFFFKTDCHLHSLL